MRKGSWISIVLIVGLGLMLGLNNGWVSAEEQKEESGEVQDRGVPGPGGIQIPPNAGVELLPPAAPSNARITIKGPHSATLAWKDNSSDELGFIVTFGKSGSTMGRYGQNANVTTWELYSGLTPNTVYCLRVQAVNHWGASAPTPQVCERTDPLTGGGGPQERTYDLTLSAQNPGVGNYIPYTGQFPILGGSLQGTLKQITNLDNRQIAFVRIGHTTEECGNPNAIVMLDPGKSTTPDTMKNIYGTSTPPLAPVFFVACTGNPPPQLLFIRITYTTQ